jgi:hypothetical protein
MLEKLKEQLNEARTRIYLQLGTYFTRKGASFLPGHKITLAKAIGKGFRGSKIKRGKRTIYVDNVYYNFKLNKLVYRFSEKPPKPPHNQKVK